MTHREQLAILALLIVLAILAWFFWPAPAASDAPVVAGAVPQSEFVAEGSGRSSSPGWAPTPGTKPPTAPPQPRTLTPATMRPSRQPVTPSTTSAASATPVRIPAPTERAVAVTAVQRGTASTYGPAFGPGWLAVPQGPGIRARVCGSARCIERTSTDSGPDRAMQRQGRIVDLSVRDFELVCGCSWTRGLIPVTVEVMP